jgi:hypothetical protein
MKRTIASGVVVAVLAGASARPEEPRPTAEMLQVLRPADTGPRITPLLRAQLDLAWAQDDARRARFEAVRTEAELLALQRGLREKALRIIGGLPTERTPLNPRVTGTLARDGYRIEKVVFESLPGLHVTALLYLPDAPSGPKPAVLLACGHSPLGKAYPAYQEIAVRLVRRGYVVLCWDPVGQGERSQFWDAARGRSRYNLVCGEHAVLGNLAILAGTSLVRYMVWDGMRAVDYLETRPEVEAKRLAITGTSGGGFQATWIGALDERIGAILPSCFVTALPMRMAIRFFDDPDSDPEQDPPGLVEQGVDHPGLLLLAYPRPVHVAAAVKDFFPIEGARKTARELRRLYEAFGHGDLFALSEGYHDHRYGTENQASAFGHLDRWMGRPARDEPLESVKPVEAEGLRCTPSGQVRVDLPGRSLQEIIRDVYRQGKARVVRLADLYGPYRAARPSPQWEAAGGAAVGAWRIDRYVLHTGDTMVLPLLHVHGTGASSGRVVLRIGLDGKLRPEEWPEVAADLKGGDSVVSFDPRGLGETKMRYKAVSIDDPELAALDETSAYTSPVSGVLANYAYNGLLTGRPYLFDVIEDAEIAARFSRERLGGQRVAVGELGDARALAAAIAAALPGVELAPARPGSRAFSWSEAVEEMREVWPIHYLLPGGAYVRLEP